MKMTAGTTHISGAKQDWDPVTCTARTNSPDRTMSEA